MSEDGFTFEPSSFDEGAGAMRDASEGIGSVGDEYASVQGKASEQLGNSPLTAPAAPGIDKVEKVLADATKAARGDLDYNADNLDGWKETTQGVEGRNTELARGIGRDAGSAGSGSGQGSGSLSEMLNGPAPTEAEQAAREAQIAKERADLHRMLNGTEPPTEAEKAAQEAQVEQQRVSLHKMLNGTEPPTEAEQAEQAARARQQYKDLFKSLNGREPTEAELAQHDEAQQAQQDAGDAAAARQSRADHYESHTGEKPPTEARQANDASEIDDAIAKQWRALRESWDI
ncbi:MAG: hypothetical protein J2P25_22130 [Nocardiopsaceae bacterium]|nr:hypothetical protein [Nocardiopsaceae bacterium]